MSRPSHDSIAAAAEEVFGHKGYGAASLRDLMAAAGCSTTAFYARFESKEAVLEALLRQLLMDLHDEAARILPSTRSFAEGWTRGVDVLVATLRDRKGLVRVALTEAGQIPSSREILRQAYGLLAALLADQLRKSSRRAMDDAEDRAWALVGALQMQVVRWAVYEEITEDELPNALTRVAGPLLPQRRGRSK